MDERAGRGGKGGSGWFVVNKTLVHVPSKGEKTIFNELSQGLLEGPG